MKQQRYFSEVDANCKRSVSDEYEPICLSPRTRDMKHKYFHPSPIRHKCKLSMEGFYSMTHWKDAHIISCWIVYLLKIPLSFHLSPGLEFLSEKQYNEILKKTFEIQMIDGTCCVGGNTLNSKNKIRPMPTPLTDPHSTMCSVLGYLYSDKDDSS